MAGITSWTMPVCVGVDTVGSGTAWIACNEGLGRALRHDVNGPDVLDRLCRFCDLFGPLVGDARPTGAPVDRRRVLRTGILPVLHSSIVHREPGIGQVGAGVVHPPPRLSSLPAGPSSRQARPKPRGTHSMAQPHSPSLHTT
jgi:hypothetical protein